MEDTFRPNHLLLEELEYELNIRNVVSSRSQQDKRKILNRLLEKERVKPGSLIDLKNYEFDFDVEQEAITKTLDSVKNLIADFEGTSSDSTFLRVKSRIAHVTGRVMRIPVVGDEAKALTDFKNESYATCLELEADLHERVRPVVPNDDLDQTVNSPIIHMPAPVVTCASKSIPISQWGVKFSGDPKHVYSFIERVTELAQARKFSDQDLFDSAVELFVGDAFVWYRSIKTSVDSWNALVFLMKKDFLPPNAEDEIWEQIKHRKQKRHEKVTIYFAQMGNLFSRLGHAPHEITKVKHIRNNLLPEYLGQLALSEVETVPQLFSLCKRLEEAAYLQSRHNFVPQVSNLSVEVSPSTSRSCCCLETSKPNVENNHQSNSIVSKAPKTQVVASSSRGESGLVNTGTSAQTRDIICWNCGKPNHTFSSCKVKRKIFCFRCGTPNVRISNCKKCSKNH